jgi:hypothetical protein
MAALQGIPYGQEYREPLVQLASISSGANLHDEIGRLAICRNFTGSLLEVDVAPVRRTWGADERANREAVGVSINSKESREASATGGVVLFERTSVILPVLVTGTRACEKMQNAYHFTISARLHE